MVAGNFPTELAFLPFSSILILNPKQLQKNLQQIYLRLEGTMRLARQTKYRQWHIVEEIAGVCHLRPLDWGVDRNGHWPRVDLMIYDLDAQVHCPCCAKVFVLQEMDCVFGLARKDGFDVIILVRCLNCRLPSRIRVKGFMHTYPFITERMEGWTDWEQRRLDCEAEERKLYGQECSPSTSL